GAHPLVRRLRGRAGRHESRSDRDSGARVPEAGLVDRGELDAVAGRRAEALGWAVRIDGEHREPLGPLVDVAAVVAAATRLHVLAVIDQRHPGLDLPVDD